jgi:hypothetical protein
MYEKEKGLCQGCTNSGRQVVRATKFCTVVAGFFSPQFGN